jgi:DNA-binding transcriptional LysR family regulator
MAQIEAFLALAEELHFGRAAQRLHISQPRVSRLIASLEREAGGRLFERTSRKVTLTPLGQQLHTELQPAYDQMTAALDTARTNSRGVAGVLRIGFTASTQGEALTRLVAAFETGNHGCQALLYEVDIFDPYGALRHGEVDVLVNWLALDEPDLTAGPAIDRRERVLAVGATHPLANRPSVSAEELADYETAAGAYPSLPTALTDAIWPPRTPSGRPIRRTLVPLNIHEGVTEVARGHIVHPTMAGIQLFRRDDIALIPIRDLPPMPLGLIWRTAHAVRPVTAHWHTAPGLIEHSGPDHPRHSGTRRHSNARPNCRPPPRDRCSHPMNSSDVSRLLYKESPDSPAPRSHLC